MMYPLILSLLIMSSISIITLKLSLLMSKKKKKNMEKNSPFECGFTPISNSRVPLSMRFFLISIIFLIFDVEIALLLPMIFSFPLSNPIIWFYSSMFILTILILGLFHEWNQGALSWN